MIKIPHIFRQASAPIGWKQPVLHIAVERRMRPVAHLPHQAVFYRVEISIKNMTFQIGIITDFMFPKPPLPNACFTFSLLAGIRMAAAIRQAFGKIGFQNLHDTRKIIAVFRQPQHQMEMAGQDGNRNGFKRAMLQSFPIGLAKFMDIPHQPITTAVLQNRRDEVSAAVSIIAAVVGHDVFPFCWND